MLGHFLGKLTGMKPENLKEQIQKNNISPVYFFSGDEEYLKEEAIRSLINYVVKPDTEPFCLDVFRGDDVGAADILPVVSLVPMMSDRRVVIIRDFHRLSQKDREALVTYTEQPVLSTVLIIECHRINLKTQIYKRLTETSDSVVFYTLFPERIPTWLKQHILQYNKRLTSEAAQQMLAIVGTDLRELVGELQKLVIFIGERETIEIQDVENTLGPIRTGSVFDITEAVGEKNLAKALGAYERALDSGDAPQAMIGLFVRHLMILWKIRFLKRDRLTDDSIKKKLQLGWGFNRFFDRYVAQSKLLSGRTLQDGFEVLYEADLALKTSLFKPEIIMRHLLYELCVDRT